MCHFGGLAGAALQGRRAGRCGELSGFADPLPVPRFEYVVHEAEAGGVFDQPSVGGGFGLVEPVLVVGGDGREAGGCADIEVDGRAGAVGGAFRLGDSVAFAAGAFGCVVCGRAVGGDDGQHVLVARDAFVLGAGGGDHLAQGGERVGVELGLFAEPAFARFRVGEVVIGGGCRAAVGEGGDEGAGALPAVFEGGERRLVHRAGGRQAVARLPGRKFGGEAVAAWCAHGSDRGAGLGRIDAPAGFFAAERFDFGGVERGGVACGGGFVARMTGAAGVERRDTVRRQLRGREPGDD